eukprot:g147.t1
MDFECLSDAIVLDNGSGYIKTGLANNHELPIVVPQLIGRAKLRKIHSVDRETFIGSRAQQMSSVSFISSPSDRGIIHSYDDQSSIFENVLCNELQIDPYEHSLLISTLPVPNQYQEKRMTSELFEKLYVQSLVKKPDSVLTLLDAGLVTGVVLDCGDSISHSSSIYHGNVLLNSVQKLQVGGKDVSEYLSRVVSRESGFYTKTRSALEQIRSLKESLLSLRKSLRNKSNLRKVSALDYNLPDGQKIHIDSDAIPELYKATEVLFNPDMVGVYENGVVEMLLSSIEESDPLLQEILFDNVVLSGGSSLLSGFKKRVEIGSMDLCGLKPKIVSLSSPQLSVYRGGVILANLSSFQKMSVTRQEYFEEGPERIEYKFG